MKTVRNALFVVVCAAALCAAATDDNITLVRDDNATPADLPLAVQFADFKVTGNVLAPASASATSANNVLVSWTDTNATTASLVANDFSAVKGSLTTAAGALVAAMDNTLYMGNDKGITKLDTTVTPLAAAEFAPVDCSIAMLANTNGVACVNGAGLLYINSDASTKVASLFEDGVTKPTTATSTALLLETIATKLSIVFAWATTDDVVVAIQDTTATTGTNTLSAKYAVAGATKVGLAAMGDDILVYGLAAGKVFYFQIGSDGTLKANSSLETADGYTAVTYANNSLFAIKTTDLSIISLTATTEQVKTIPFTANAQGNTPALTSVSVFTTNQVLVFGTMKTAGGDATTNYFFAIATADGEITQNSTSPIIKTGASTSASATAITPTKADTTPATLFGTNSAYTDITPTAATLKTVALPTVYNILNKIVPTAATTAASVTLKSVTQNVALKASSFDLQSLTGCTATPNPALQTPFALNGFDFSLSNGDNNAKQTTDITLKCFGAFSASIEYTVQYALEFATRVNFFSSSTDSISSIAISDNDDVLVEIASTENTQVLVTDETLTNADTSKLFVADGASRPYMPLRSSTANTTGIVIGGDKSISKYVTTAAAPEPETVAKVACQVFTSTPAGGIYCLDTATGDLVNLGAATAQTPLPGVTINSYPTTGSPASAMTVDSDGNVILTWTTGSAISFVSMKSDLSDNNFSFTFDMAAATTQATPAATNDFKTISVSQLASGEFVVSGITTGGNFYYFTVSGAGTVAADYYISKGDGYTSVFTNTAVNMLYAMKSTTVAVVTFGTTTTIESVSYNTAAAKTGFSLVGGAAFSKGEVLIAAKIVGTKSSAWMLIVSPASTMFGSTTTAEYVINNTKLATAETTTKSTLTTKAGPTKPVAKNGTAVTVTPTLTTSAFTFPSIYNVLNSLVPSAGTTTATYLLTTAGADVNAADFNLQNLTGCTTSIDEKTVPTWFTLAANKFALADDATMNSFYGTVEIECYGYITASRDDFYLSYLDNGAYMLPTTAANSPAGSMTTAHQSLVLEMTSTDSTVLSLLTTNLQTVSGTVSIPAKGQAYAPFVSTKNQAGVYVSGTKSLTSYVPGSTPSTLAGITCSQLTVDADNNVYCLSGTDFVFVPYDAQSTTQSFTKVSSTAVTADDKVAMMTMGTGATTEFIAVAANNGNTDTTITMFSRTKSLADAGFAKTASYPNGTNSKIATINVAYKTQTATTKTYIVHGLTTTGYFYYFTFTVTTATGAVAASDVTVSSGAKYSSTVYNVASTSLFALNETSVTMVDMSGNTVTRKDIDYSPATGTLLFTSMNMYGSGRLLLRGTLTPKTGATDLGYFFLVTDTDGNLSQAASATTYVIESKTPTNTTGNTTTATVTVAATAVTVTKGTMANTDNKTAATTQTLTLPTRYTIFNNKLPSSPATTPEVTLYLGVEGVYDFGASFGAPEGGNCSLALTDPANWFSLNGTTGALNLTADATKSESATLDTTITCYGLFTATGKLTVMTTIFTEIINMYVQAPTTAPVAFEVSSSDYYAVSNVADKETAITLFSKDAKTYIGTVIVDTADRPFATYVSGDDTGVFVGGADAVTKYLPNDNVTSQATTANEPVKPAVLAKLACATMAVSGSSLYCLNGTEFSYVPSDSTSATANFASIEVTGLPAHVTATGAITVGTDVAFAWFTSTGDIGFATFATGLASATAKAHTLYSMAGLAKDDAFETINVSVMKGGDSYLVYGTTKDGYFYFVMFSSTGAATNGRVSKSTGYIKTMYNPIYNSFQALTNAAITTVAFGTTMTITNVPYKTSSTAETFTLLDFSLYSNGQVIIFGSLTKKDAKVNGYVYIVGDGTGNLKETGTSDIVQVETATNPDLTVLASTAKTTVVGFATKTVAATTTAVTSKTGSKLDIPVFDILSEPLPESTTTTVDLVIEDDKEVALAPASFGLTSFDNCTVSVPDLPKWLTFQKPAFASTSKKHEKPFEGTATVTCYDALLTATAPVEVTLDRKGDSASALFSVAMFFAIFAQFLLF